MDYDTSKQLARDTDPAVRRDLAMRADLRPEMLYFLAGDAEAQVRVAVADNESTPRQADLVLASDIDEDVRSTLAGKIARLVPSLPADARDQLTQLTVQILEKLARDQATRVRSVLSDALKDMPQAPGSVVHKLARDIELSVAGPILRHSPILTDEDLLEIIRDGTGAGGLAQMAQRKTVGTALADAIAASDDAQAVAALLANPSAQIREQTLDAIVEKAPKHEPWHEPLVRRPALPLRAMKRLAEFVSTSLVKALQERPDVDGETARAMGETVKRRLDPAKAAAEPAEGGAEKARRLAKEGKLTESEMTAAVDRQDRAFVVAGLATMANVPDKVIEQMLASGNGKVLFSLGWKVGLTARLSHALQIKIARIPRKDVLNLRDGTGFPISKAQMMWELEGYGIT
jgi:uncharacterized protein (DUF2336 family)